MAKKAKKVSKAAIVADVAAGTVVGVRPILEVPDGTPSFYANFIEVSNTPWDFSLIFAMLPTKLNPSRIQSLQETGTLPISAQLTVNFPPTLLAGLIRALTAQKELYEKTMGTELVEPQPQEPR